MSNESSEPCTTIVIIGAGFSGAMTAVNLLRKAPARRLRVVLVNKSGRMARGIAYGTRSADHVLNVPAGNMSALPDDPDDFLRFCRWSDPETAPGSFVSRRIYGTYLEAMLSTAEQCCGERAVLERRVGEVLHISAEADDAKARVWLDDGQQILADHVVLAFGHFLPANPPVSTPEFYGSARYVRDPWAAGALDRVGDGDSVLLLGTGLTAVDVTLALQRPGAKVKVTCLSRRGLAPQPHRSTRSQAPPPDVHLLLSQMGSTARGYVAAVRRHVEARALLGEDWRDVLAALRPHTPALWQRLPVSERARFLRHVQPHWDVLRHRCAPTTFQAYERLLASGAVTPLAGRIIGFEHGQRAVAVRIRRRGAQEFECIHVDWVINCTGPDSNLNRVMSPLVRELLKQSLMKPDCLGLGLEVAENYALMDAQGQRSRWLHYIGPLLKARDWEATAVPELRVHAGTLAQHLLNA